MSITCLSEAHASGVGTITYVLYADDNTTPKWTWVYTTETGVRAKAT